MGQALWSDGPFYKNLSPEQTIALYDAAVSFLSKYPGIPAEDIAADAMINAASGRFSDEGRDPIDSRKSYLYRIARNLAINYVRLRPTRSLRHSGDTLLSIDAIAHEDRGILHERLASAANAEDDAIHADVRSLLEQALEELEPQPWAVALRAHYLEGKSYDEIAREYQMPFGSVCTRIDRGLDRLREWFEDRGLSLNELLPTRTQLASSQRQQN